MFEENFTAPALAADRWVAHYLPHWSTPERSAARYDLDAGVLGTLRIEADQPPWLPEEELAGVQHPNQLLSWPGRLRPRDPPPPSGSDRQDGPAHPPPVHPIDRDGGGEVCGRAADPTCMLAIWLVGFEETTPEQEPARSASLSSTATRSAPMGSTVRLASERHHDPRRREDMADLALDIDATDWHTYAAAWTPRGDPLLRRRPAGPHPVPGPRLPAAANDQPVRVPADRFATPPRTPRTRAGRLRAPAVTQPTGPTTTAGEVRTGSTPAGHRARPVQRRGPQLSAVSAALKGRTCRCVARLLAPAKGP